jgi:hypothetical protein
MLVANCWPMAEARTMLCLLHGALEVSPELGCSLSLPGSEEDKYEALLGMHLTPWGQSALKFVMTSNPASSSIWAFIFFGYLSS